MELGWIVLQQTIVMFLLMAVGYVLYRLGIVTDSGNQELSRMLISLVIPAVIVKSYLVEFSMEKLRNLGWSFLAFLLGVLLFLLPVEVPAILTNCVGYVANMNTPLAMIILGVYLAQSRLSDIFTEKSLYVSSAVRLLLIPALTLGLLTLLPLSYEIRMAVFLASAAPAGANVAVFAKLCRLDSGHAAALVCNSTILSIFSLPVMVMLASAVW